MHRRLARRLVALAAAYALVLNTWLPALAGILAPQAGGETSTAVICATIPGGGVPASDLPQKRSPLCPFGGTCGMPACMASALTGGHSIAPVIPRADAARDALTAAPGAAPWRGGSRLARGPPDA